MKNCDKLKARMKKEELHFPQIRMQRLLTLIGDEVLSFIKKKLALEAGIDIWKGTLAEVERALKSSMRICRDWSKMVGLLTGTDWAQYEEFPWRGNQFNDVRMAKTAERLEMVGLCRRADGEGAGTAAVLGGDAASSQRGRKV